MRRQLLTSESVTEGHPDKIADQISDAILDAVLEQDPEARVACEVMLTGKLVVLGGEISTTARVNFEDLARRQIERIGYNDPALEFDAQSCQVITAISAQSPDIAEGVSHSLEARAGESGERVVLGAGDQGMVFGYACDETPQLMPLPIALAHQLAETTARLRHNNDLPGLRPDGKTQVTLQYEDGQATAIDRILISHQHDPDLSQPQLKEMLLERVVLPTLRQSAPAILNEQRLAERLLINPSGRFIIGGPIGDCGLTGRKTAVDTYGGLARHGGGAFSGKDPSKVDRSASYVARQVAKTIVAAGLAQRCEVQIAYAIGVAEPVSLAIDCFASDSDSDALLAAVRQVFDLRPGGIIADLGLRAPIYLPTASYGHFGRAGFSWEDTSGLAETLKSAL